MGPTIWLTVPCLVVFGISHGVFLVDVLPAVQYWLSQRFFFKGQRALQSAKQNKAVVVPFSNRHDFWTWPAKTVSYYLDPAYSKYGRNHSLKKKMEDVSLVSKESRQRHRHCAPHRQPPVQYSALQQLKRFVSFFLLWRGFSDALSLGRKSGGVQNKAIHSFSARRLKAKPVNSLVWTSRKQIAKLR